MTAPSSTRSIGQLVSDALEDVRAIIEHEKALLKAEVTRAAKAGGVGAGLVAAAVGTLSLAVIYLLIAAAEGLIAAGLPRWAGFLIVGGALLLVAVLLGLVGALTLKKVRGPQRSVEQGKATVADVKDALAGHDDRQAGTATSAAGTGGAAAAGAGTRSTGPGSSTGPGPGGPRTTGPIGPTAPSVENDRAAARAAQA